MTTASSNRKIYRPWPVRIVVIRVSRKLTATYRIRIGCCLSSLLVALLVVASPVSIALPSGLDVVVGQASVSTPQANAMQINQSTDKAVLNWQSFNIGTGQLVQFIQPGSSSVALNRVVGAGASAIFGSLSANGQVFLINPAGVMFAPGAQVNVGGLVATSLAIGDGDFMAGRYTFSGASAGAVVNYGNLSAARGGYVVLAAPQVNNGGTVNAEAGSVGLLAGSRVSVDTSGVGLVRFSVDAAAAGAAIANSGAVTADGGQVAVLASAMGDALSTVINQSGVIRANTVVERNGRIVLSGGEAGVVNVSGRLDAVGTSAGQTGGTVKVLGDKVALTESAVIDASGQAGGGTVLVGGNYQGQGPEQNAGATYVGGDVRIAADALQNGRGGTVVVWSDDVTRFEGSITARGGSQGGDGGLVETSGKEFLHAAGNVDASATQGVGGVWLLDPRNVSIQGSVSKKGKFVANVFTPSGDDAVASRKHIQDALNKGTNIKVTTGTTGTQAGDITIVDSITKSAGAAASLTLEAAGSIFVNNAVSSTSNALNVNLNATLATTFAAAGSLTTNGGNVSITGSGLKTLGSINTTGASGPGNLTVGSGGEIIQLGSTTLAIKGGMTLAAGAANVTLNNAGNDFTGPVSVTSAGNVSLRDANALVLGASTVSGSLTAVAGGALTQSGAITTPTLVAKTLADAGAAITLTNLGNDAGSIKLQARNAADTANAAGTLQYADSNGFDVAAIATAGNVTLAAGGDVIQSGAIAASGLALTGASGAYVLGHADNTVNTLAASTSSIDYKQSGALAVGTVEGVAGVTTTGVARIETTGAASNLTLNNAVSSSASGDAVVLKAGSSNAAGVGGGGQLVNNVGAGGIVASSGRYLVYSGDPGATVEGVAGHNKRYNSDANYLPAGSASTFLYRVAPTLTVTVDNKTKVYGDSNPALTGVVSGLIDGDTAAGVGVSYTTTAVDRTAVSASPVAITADAVNNENYLLAFTDGGLTITQRALTVSASGQNRVYDGSTVAGVTLADNRLSGDTLTLANAAASFADKNVGTGKAVSVSGISVTGTDAGNYSFNTTASTSADITRASISGVSGITAADKTYDGTTSATLDTASAGYAGQVGGDVLSVATAAGNFDSPTAGSGKTVYITGITLGGTDAGNYTLVKDRAAATAAIRAASSVVGTPSPLVLPVTVNASVASTLAQALAPVTAPAPALESAELTVADMNALLENAPTAAGGCLTSDGDGCESATPGIFVRMVREFSEQDVGIVWVGVDSKLVRGGESFRFPLPASILAWGAATAAPVQVTTLTGDALPAWLNYDPATWSFVAKAVPPNALPLQVRVRVGNRSTVLTIHEMQGAGSSMRKASL